MMQNAASQATVTWGKGPLSGRASAARLTDTAANRAKLLADAAKDRLPSALVDMGQDVVLLSGAALTTASRLARTTGGSVAKGDKLAVDGVEGSVLSTDDGFSEIDASGIIIAVIDTGVDVNHPAFKGRIVKPFNANDGTSNVTDAHGHGTHVAGIVAGAWGLDAQAGGVAANAKIMPIKAANEKGGFRASTVAKAIRYAADNGAKVINMSIGSSFFYMPYVKDAVAYAESKGAVVVAASGNDGKDKVANPGRIEGVLAVGSSKDGARSKFSNGGNDLDLSAPGEGIVSAVPGGTYAAKSGTSMAAPYTAGAIALVMAQHPDWKPAQVIAHMNSATNDLGAKGWDKDFGYGEVNLFKAVFGENLAVVPRAPETTQKSLWQRILGLFGLD